MSKRINSHNNTSMGSILDPMTDEENAAWSAEVSGIAMSLLEDHFDMPYASKSKASMQLLLDTPDIAYSAEFDVYTENNKYGFLILK